jgi:hypothetical protein
MPRYMKTLLTGPTRPFTSPHRHGVEQVHINLADPANVIDPVPPAQCCTKGDVVLVVHLYPGVNAAHRTVEEAVGGRSRLRSQNRSMRALPFSSDGLKTAPRLMLTGPSPG